MTSIQYDLKTGLESKVHVPLSYDYILSNEMNGAAGHDSAL